MINVSMSGFLAGDASVRQIGERWYNCFRVPIQGRRDYDPTLWVSVHVPVRNQENKMLSLLRKGAGVVVTGRVTAKPYINNQGQPDSGLTIWATELDILRYVDAAERPQQMGGYLQGAQQLAQQQGYAPAAPQQWASQPQPAPLPAPLPGDVTFKKWDGTGNPPGVNRPSSAYTMTARNGAPIQAPTPQDPTQAADVDDLPL